MGRQCCVIRLLWHCRHRLVQWAGLGMTVQLAMFESQFSYQTLHEAKASLQGMVPEVKKMFTQVELLVRLMLLCPVSSCEAERSFSCLRDDWRPVYAARWHSSVSSSQLCHCHAHQEVLDNLPISAIAAEFAERSDIRRSVFGNGPF